MVADTVRMSEVYSYCMDGGKDGLDQQQRQYPEIRTLSRAELINCLRDIMRSEQFEIVRENRVFKSNI